jgi:predicted RNA-binding Zn ribbon-like protein
MSLQKFIVAAGTIGLLRVIGDPAGHKQARQVRPSKLSLRPISRLFRTRRGSAAAAPAEREEISEAAYDEIVAGWRAGNLAWARKWGPAPGEVGCRVPLAVLKRNRLA